MKQKAVLLILDGYGHAENGPGNAVYTAPTPWMDLLSTKFPFTYLHAHGQHVGLDLNRMGNSEIGHLTIGAGRIIETDIVMIFKEISEGKMADRIRHIENDRVHIVGMISEGGVHGHIDIMKSVIRNVKSKRVLVHVIADGRDSAPKCVISHINELKRFFKEINKGEIVSLSGRYFSMDRDNRIERTNKAYNMMCNEKCTDNNDDLDANKLQSFDNTVDIYDYINKLYVKECTDEFIPPKLLNTSGKILPGETIIFTNFRADRMRQLVRKFQYTNECHTMTEYDPSLNVKPLFSKKIVKNTLGEVISDAGFTQVHIAESEKYAHVTYFFNGGSEKPFHNEFRHVIDSKKVPTHDLMPEMCIADVSNKVIDSMNNKNDFIVCNFAAPDMVGHTGKFLETCEAVSACDLAIGKIYEATFNTDYALFITSDHGNAERMIDSEGNICKKHTTNKVPFLACINEMKMKHGDFSLADVAPTILGYMRLSIPIEMTGTNMLELKTEP